MLDPAHGLDRRRIESQGEIIFLGHADSVLSGYGSTQGDGQDEDFPDGFIQ